MDGLKPEELDELLNGRKKSQQRNYNDYTSRTSSSKSFNPDYINSLERKSYSDSYTSQGDYRPTYRRKSEKRRLQEENNYDLKELEELVNELLKT